MGISHSGVAENLMPVARVPQGLSDPRSEGKSVLTSRLSFHGRCQMATNNSSTMNANASANVMIPHNTFANSKPADTSSEALVLLNHLSLNWAMFEEKFDDITQLFVEILLTNDIANNGTITSPKPPWRNVANGSRAPSLTEEETATDSNSMRVSARAPPPAAAAKFQNLPNEEKGLANLNGLSSSFVFPTHVQQRGRNNLLPSLQQEKPPLGAKKSSPPHASSGQPTKDTDVNAPRQRTARAGSLKGSFSQMDAAFSDIGAFDWTNDEVSMMQISPTLRIAVLELGYVGMRCVVDTLSYLAFGECHKESVVRPPAEWASSNTPFSAQSTNSSVPHYLGSDTLNNLSGIHPDARCTPRGKLEMTTLSHSPRRHWPNSTESYSSRNGGGLSRIAALNTVVFMDRGSNLISHSKCTNDNLNTGLKTNVSDRSRNYCPQRRHRSFMTKSLRERGYNSELLMFINFRSSKSPRCPIINKPILPHKGMVTKLSDGPHARNDEDASQRPQATNLSPLFRNSRQHSAAGKKVSPLPSAPSISSEGFRVGEAGGSRASVYGAGGGRGPGSGDTVHHTSTGGYDRLIDQEAALPGFYRGAVLDALCEVFAHLHLTEGDLAVMIMSLIVSALDVQESEQVAQQKQLSPKFPTSNHAGKSRNGEHHSSQPCAEAPTGAGSVSLESNHHNSSQIGSHKDKTSNALSENRSFNRLPNSSIWVIVMKLVRTYFMPPLSQARKILQFASGCIGRPSSEFAMGSPSRRESRVESNNLLHNQVVEGACIQKSGNSLAIKGRSKLNSSVVSSRSQAKLTSFSNATTPSTCVTKTLDSLNYHVSTNYDILYSQSHAFFRKYSALFNLPTSSKKGSQLEADQKTSLSSCSLSQSNFQSVPQQRQKRLNYGGTSKVKSKIMNNVENGNFITSTLSASNDILSLHGAQHGYHVNFSDNSMSASPKNFLPSSASPASNFKIVKRRLGELLVQKRSFVLHFAEHVDKGRRMTGSLQSDFIGGSLHPNSVGNTHQQTFNQSTELAERTPTTARVNFQEARRDGDDTNPSQSGMLPAIGKGAKDNHKSSVNRRLSFNPVSKEGEEEIGNDIIFPLRTRMLILCRQYVYLYDAIPSTFAMLGIEQTSNSDFMPAYLNTPIALLDTARNALSDFYIVSGPTDTETAMVPPTRQVRGALVGGQASPPFPNNTAPLGDLAPDGKSDSRGVSPVSSTMTLPFPGSNHVDVDVFRTRNEEGGISLLTLPIAQPPHGEEDPRPHDPEKTPGTSPPAVRPPSEAKTRLPGLDSTLYARRSELFLFRKDPPSGGDEKGVLWGTHSGITHVVGNEAVGITVYPLRILYKGVLHHFLFQKVGTRAWWYMRLTELVTVCQSAAHALKVAASRQSVYAFIRNRISYTVGPSAFECVDMLGVGAFGRVLLVRHKLTGKLFAMKIVRKTCFHGVRNVIEIRRECAILESLDCPYIMKIHACFQSDSRVYILLDYLPGCELLMHTQRALGHRFEEPAARFYIAELAIAVEHLRLHGILHRDVKGDNLVLDVEGHVVLTDFGFAKKITVDDDLYPTQGDNPPGRVVRQRTGCGTRAYIAPEVLNATLPNEEGYGLEADWWSMGVVLFTLTTGCFPFLRKTEHETNVAITQSPLQFPPHVALSEAARDVLLMLMQKDPARRITTLAQLKRHAFFNGFDWEACEKRQLRPPVSLHKDSYNTPSSSSAASRRLKEAVRNALCCANDAHSQKLPVSWDSREYSLTNTRYAKEFKQEKKEMLLLESAFGPDVIPMPIQVENDVFGPLYDNQELFSSMRDAVDTKYDYDARGYIPEVSRMDIVLFPNGEQMVYRSNGINSTANGDINPLDTAFTDTCTNVVMDSQQQFGQSTDSKARASFGHSNPLSMSYGDTGGNHSTNGEVFRLVLDDYKEENYSPIIYMPNIETHTAPETAMPFPQPSFQKGMVRTK